MAAFNPFATANTQALTKAKRDEYGQDPNGKIFVGRVSEIGQQRYGGPRNRYVAPGELARQFAGLSASNPGTYQSLQFQLYQGGYYSSKPVFGNYRSQDNAAIGNALKSYQLAMQANGGTPITFSEYLGRASAQGQANYDKGDGYGGGGGGGGGGAAPVVQVTDPESIKATVQQAAQAALGRQLNAKQLKKFVAHFQGAQRSIQTSGASEVSAPDLGADAAAFVQSENPKEFAKAQGDNYLAAFVNLLSGGEGVQRATFTPTADTSPGPAPMKKSGKGRGKG